MYHCNEIARSGSISLSWVLYGVASGRTQVLCWVSVCVSCVLSSQGDDAGRGLHGLTHSSIVVVLCVVVDVVP